MTLSEIKLPVRMLNFFSNNNSVSFLFTSVFRTLIGEKTKLQGVNGYTGRGEFEHYIWKNGARRVDIRLRGVAGKTAEIYFDGAKVTDITVKDGVADDSFELPSLTNEESSSGAIEVRQNNHAILSGCIRQD